ncbi:MAG: cytochrome c [Acidobacteria bacterium]|nr:cytochrome c [Acidobacteriota bacterium]MCI0724528.1 cytochrome c [Acidobacteriota bacterium]
MTTPSGLRTMLSGLLGAALLLSTLAFAQKVEPTPENLSKGQAIYKKHCQMCHGVNGVGDGPAGKRLNPKPYNLTDKEKMAGETDEHLFKNITKGKGPMPAFQRKLKEPERWMVLHYVRTFSK